MHDRKDRSTITAHWFMLAFRVPFNAQSDKLFAVFGVTIVVVSSASLLPLGFLSSDPARFNAMIGIFVGLLALGLIFFTPFISGYRAYLEKYLRISAGHAEEEEDRGRTADAPRAPVCKLPYKSGLIDLLFPTAMCTLFAATTTTITYLIMVLALREYLSGGKLYIVGCLIGFGVGGLCHGGTSSLLVKKIFDSSAIRDHTDKNSIHYVKNAVLGDEDLPSMPNTNAIIAISAVLFGFFAAGSTALSLFCMESIASNVGDVVLSHTFNVAVLFMPQLIVSALLTRGMIYLCSNSRGNSD